MPVAPTNYDFGIVRGDTWDETFALFSDAANTTPFDLSGGWGASLSVAGAPDIVLTGSAGLTLGGALGTIAVLVDADTTMAQTAGDRHWFLRLIDPGGKVRTIARGTVTWSDP